MAYLEVLPADLVERIAELATDLSDFAADARDEFDKQPESWRESEQGINTDAWIEEIDEICNKLESINDAP